jgi:hypothetical protein
MTAFGAAVKFLTGRRFEDPPRVSLARLANVNVVGVDPPLVYAAIRHLWRTLLPALVPRSPAIACVSVSTEGGMNLIQAMVVALQVTSRVFSTETMPNASRS